MSSTRCQSIAAPPFMANVSKPHGKGDARKLRMGTSASSIPSPTRCVALSGDHLKSHVQAWCGRSTRSSSTGSGLEDSSSSCRTWQPSHHLFSYDPSSRPSTTRRPATKRSAAMVSPSASSFSSSSPSLAMSTASTAPSRRALRYEAPSSTSSTTAAQSSRSRLVRAAATVWASSPAWCPPT